MKKEEAELKKALYGTLVSYVNAGGSEKSKKRIKILQLYLKELGFDMDIKTLALEVKEIRTKIEHQNSLKTAEAELFTGKDEPRRYRYGSAFCPQCGMYKNYSKECPYCSFHEMGP